MGATLLLPSQQPKGWRRCLRTYVLTAAPYLGIPTDTVLDDRVRYNGPVLE